METIKELTKAEEQIMQVLWSINKGFIKDILEQLPDPKPAYNTVSTIVRILETKGFVSHKSYGKSHQYFPIISHEDYKSFATAELVKGHFANSFKNLVSFFVKDKNIDLKETDELIKLLEKFKNEQK